jgi:hypothetical protein
LYANQTENFQEKNNKKEQAPETRGLCKKQQTL